MLLNFQNCFSYIINKYYHRDYFTKQGGQKSSMLLPYAHFQLTEICFCFILDPTDFQRSDYLSLLQLIILITKW